MARAVWLRRDGGVVASELIFGFVSWGFDD